MTRKKTSSRTRKGLKSGQARVPTSAEWERLFLAIQEHRYPEKNTAIMRISQKLGLRVQEIALLQIKEIARLKKSSPGFTLHQVMTLPAAYTKGADAMNRSKVQYQRRSITFSTDRFQEILNQVAALTKAGIEVDPTQFYPKIKAHQGKTRELPLVDADLRLALEEYLKIRLEKDPTALPTDPLFLTQQKVPYSPNTLQEHMALMLRGWAGIEKASSHSGRRSLITNIIHKQKKSVKIAQKIAGHKSAATTIIYEEPPEEEISNALKNVD